MLWISSSKIQSWKHATWTSFSNLSVHDYSPPSQPLPIVMINARPNRPFSAQGPVAGQVRWQEPQGGLPSSMAGGADGWHRLAAVICELFKECVSVCDNLWQFLYKTSCDMLWLYIEMYSLNYKNILYYLTIILVWLYFQTHFFEVLQGSKAQEAVWDDGMSVDWLARQPQRFEMYSCFASISMDRF
jgi:hypothetical protein